MPSTRGWCSRTARTTYLEAIAINRQILAENLCLQGRTDAGRGLFRDALASLRASVPETHSAVRSAREAASRCAVESLP